MQERQEFLDHYFVFSDETSTSRPRTTRGPTASSKTSASRTWIDEKRVLEELTRPREIKTHEPGQPLELPAPLSGNGPRRPTATRGPARRPRRPGQPRRRPAPPPPRAQRRPAGAQRREDGAVAMPASSAFSASSWFGGASCRRQARGSLGRAARARDGSARSGDQHQRGRRDGAGARSGRRGAAPGRERIDPADIRRRWRRACPSRSRRCTGSSSCARTTPRSTWCAPTRSTRRRSTTCASSSASPWRPPSAAAIKIEDAINRVYERQAGEEQLESDDARRRRGGRERHPRLGRRGAGHPLGQLAVPPGDEGARERHSHRAGRERGHRPLPDRRRALRGAPRPARLHEQHRQPHQDRERAQHRREAPPAGRAHHEEDRRQGLRHPRQHHPDEPRLRADRHASPQQVERPARSARPRLQPARVRADGRPHPPPDGIILVTGPTGSGKTTTLYACINRINRPTSTS
jgi:hypothetical protein